MKKSILFSGVFIFALSLTSCSTDSYDIEDKSAELAKIQMIKNQNFVEEVAIETTTVAAKDEDSSNQGEGEPIAIPPKRD